MGHSPGSLPTLISLPWSGHCSSPRGQGWLIVPPGKGTVLGCSMGEGGSPEQGQEPEGMDPEGSSLGRWDGGVSQRREHIRRAVSRCLPQQWPPTQPPKELRTGQESGGAGGSPSEDQWALPSYVTLAKQAEEWGAHLPEGSPCHPGDTGPRDTKPHLLLLLPPQTSERGQRMQNEQSKT